MKLPCNRFEWISVCLAAIAAAIFALMVTLAFAHEVKVTTPYGQVITQDFKGFKNPKTGLGCCGGKDCKAIDSSTLEWAADAVSFIWVDGKRYWTPRDEIDGSPTSVTYGCVRHSDRGKHHPAFPGAEYARCLLLSGST